MSVAVKKMANEATLDVKKRFLEEIATMSQIKPHENLVLYDA